MKIGILIDQLIYGGVQETAIEEARHLQNTGHNVKLLVLMREGSKNFDTKLVKGLKVEFFSDSYPFLFRRSYKFPIFSFLSSLHLLSPILTPYYLRDTSFDVIISHGTTTSFTAQALWRKKGVPYVIFIHDPMPYILYKVYRKTLLHFLFPILTPLLSRLERSLVADSLCTLTGSHVHSLFIKEKDGVEPQVLYYGSKALPSLPPQRGDYLLAISRWQKEKNPFFLLKLLKAIPKAKLKIAGSWTKKADYQEFLSQIKKENLEERVEVITHFRKSDLPKFFHQARVWIHPHFEAFGLGGLEAASHGCPIIIPKGSGVTELFKHGVHGFFPKKLEAKEYKKYVEKLLDDKHLAYKMGEAAWIKTRENYSWKAHTCFLEHLLKKALDEVAITALELGHVSEIGLSGGDKLFEEMVKRLPPKYRVTVLTSCFGLSHWQKLKKRVKLFPLKPNLFDGRKNAFFYFSTYWIRIFQAIQKLKKLPKPKFIYSSTNIFPDVLPAYFFKRKNPKLVWIARVHHLIPSPLKRRGNFVVNLTSFFLQKLCLRMIKKNADLTIALNYNLARKLKTMAFSQKKLAVLGAGVDFEKISKQKAKLPKVCYEGVFLGRLHPTKGIFDAVEIWKQVVQKVAWAKLAIIGEAHPLPKAELVKKIKEQNLWKNIFLLGYLPEDEVLNILKTSKVFLFTDHEAGWGLAVAEAMACKLPVVGYDIGLFGDVYQKGYLKIKLKDTQAFAQAVIDLLTHPKKRDKLANQAFNQARTLDWEKTTQKFTKILDFFSKDKKSKRAR